MIEVPSPRPPANLPRRATAGSLRFLRPMAALLALLAAPALHAQVGRGPLIQSGGRVDVFVSNVTAVHAGIELSAVGGRYLRIAGVGGIGGSWDDGTSGLSARAELLGRFMLDPDLRSSWAPYAAGGLGARYDRVTDGWRATLILALGLEGPNLNGVLPFFEAGYGGGARFAIGLRKARPFGR